jgi:hypothetical protein
MTNLKSPEVEVNVSAKVLYNKLSNVNNLRNILPPQVSEFKSTEDSCCFKIGGMRAKDSQVPFTLECNISENGNTAKATLEINAELNMMMKMMLEKPLTNFLNLASEGLKKL